MSTSRPLRTAVTATAALTVLTALVAIRWGPLVRFDERIAAAALGAGSPGWIDAQILVTDVLSPWPWRLLVTVLAVRLYLLHRRREASLMFTPILVGGLLGGLLKLAVGRARPTQPFDIAIGGAFPSGHASTAVIACAVLALAAPRRVRVPALTAGGVVAVAVSCTRIGLDVHWASDVLGGWLLGIAVVAFTLVWGGPGLSPGGSGDRGTRTARPRSG